MKNSYFQIWGRAHGKPRTHLTMSENNFLKTMKGSCQRIYEPIRPKIKNLNIQSITQTLLINNEYIKTQKERE